MIVVAISVVMAGVIKLMPKTYTATTTLMVNPEGTIRWRPTRGPPCRCSTTCPPNRSSC